MEKKELDGFKLQLLELRDRLQREVGKAEVGTARGRGQARRDL